MMNRCFTTGLTHPTILGALFYDWGRMSLLVAMHQTQKSEISAHLVGLFTYEQVRLLRNAHRQAALAAARSRDSAR